MVATLYLLGCVLAPGQTIARPQLPPRVAPAPGSDWLLVPRLNPSQELVYRGTFTEQGRAGRVEFNRAYRIETRVFVLGTPPRGVEVALLTVLKHRPSSDGPGVGETAPSSVRLERAHVDLQGRIAAGPGVNLAVPLDGAPTLECGIFIALPGGRVRAGQEWSAVEGDRPPLVWHVGGMELVGGNSCIKLVGEQKSGDWEHPRADRPAWRRQETVWLNPRLGIAYRIEREILHREPARQEATQRSVLRLEMESNFPLSGAAGESCRQEITQALSFHDSLTPLLKQPAHYGPHLTALLKKIDYQVVNQPPTPYRAAILQVKRQAEASQRGETPPAPVPETKTAPAVATVGELAPDFLASNLTSEGSVQLRRLTGKPVLLVFFRPASPTTPAVLRYAQQLLASYPQRVTVVGMAVSDNAEQVRKQHAELGLGFPILSAGGLCGSFGVETTPKMVLLDSANIVRGGYLGWGHETPQEVRQELQRWLPTGVILPPAPR